MKYSSIFILLVIDLELIFIIFYYFESNKIESEILTKIQYIKRSDYSPDIQIYGKLSRS